MSVGFLKRSLSLLNLAAVLLICGTAYGFWNHRGDMAGPWKEPDFVIPVKKGGGAVARINNTTIQLGRYPKPAEVTQPTETEKPTEKIESVLAKLGKIVSAVVAYEPYASTRPAIIFRLKRPKDKKSANLTLALNEALETRPHSDPQLAQWGYTEPARYKFVGCVRGEDGYTYFRFDMACDGKDIQKIRWAGEAESITLKAAKGGRHSGLVEVHQKGVRVRDLSKKRTRVVRQPETAQPDTPKVEPVVRQPGDLRGELFDMEADTFAPTEEGVRYLRDNYNDILKDARTTTYKDSNGRAKGVQITSIRRGSVANKFGLLPEDVIL